MLACGEGVRTDAALALAPRAVGAPRVLKRGLPQLHSSLFLPVDLLERDLSQAQQHAPCTSTIMDCARAPPLRQSFP
jgi:hypothetical protein